VPVTDLMQILNEHEIRECAPMDAGALAAVEQAFAWLSESKVEMPPIMHISVPESDGDVDIKSAYVAGQPAMAVKIAAGFAGNRALGFPTSSGMMVVLSVQTGRCEAVLLDNCYLTDLRTGLAGAVAADHLANPGPCSVGIIGAGAQARYQLEALTLVRSVVRVYVAARSPERLAAYQAEMSAKLNIDVVICNSIEDAVRSSDIIVTTTPSTEPLVRAEWLRPGQHITAMGSDLPAKQELHCDVLLRADVIACDKPEQSRTHGELQHLPQSDDIVGKTVSLGDVVRGRVAGRSSANEITVADLSGVGVQDTAIALHVLREYRRRRQESGVE